MTLGKSQPTNIRWAVFGLACGTSWLLYLHRYTFALIKPELVREWGLTKTELGLLDGAFSITSTLFQFPLGMLTDVAGVRLVLTGLIILWCVGLGLHAWAPSVKILWYARALLGLGQSAVYANLSRLAQSWFPASLRTTLQGLAGITAGRVGGLCAYLIFGSLLLGVCGFDWRTATYLFAGSGFVFAALFAAVFRNTPAEHPLVNAAERERFTGPTGESSGAARTPRQSLASVLPTIRPRALANLAALSVQMILSTFADNIYSNWIPLFLAEVHQLRYGEMGIYSALPLLGGALAGFAGGALNDYCIRRTGNRRWSRRGVAMAGKGLAAAILLAALAWYDNPYVFCGLLFAVKFFGDWSLTTSWGVVTDIGGPVTASVFALSNAVAGLGLIVAPVIFGYVAEHQGWPTVFAVVAAAYVLCALSWLAIDCTIPVLNVEAESDR